MVPASGSFITISSKRKQLLHLSYSLLLKLTCLCYNILNGKCFLLYIHTHKVEKKVREDNFCKNTFSILRVNQYTQPSNTCRNEKIYNWIFYSILHDLKNKYVSPKSLQEVKSVKGSVSQIII